MAQSVDYDAIAGDYDARYARNDYTGIQRALAVFLATERGAESRHVLEVGCGTGHWVHVFGSAETKIVGLDVSEGMLAIARTRQSGAGLIRARAEALPCATASVDRIFCVNALHHFSDRAAFFRESRRVLARGGGLLTIGLDPHAGRDQWWIYDYFPSALAVDRQRYPPVGSIRKLMEDSGLSQCETREVQHLAMRMTVSEAERRGYLDRASTSQLMVMSQAEYESGMARIRSENRTSKGATVLHADLRVYGTTGWVG